MTTSARVRLRVSPSEPPCPANTSTPRAPSPSLSSKTTHVTATTTNGNGAAARNTQPKRQRPESTHHPLPTAHPDENRRDLAALWDAPTWDAPTSHARSGHLSISSQGTSRRDTRSHVTIDSDPLEPGFEGHGPSGGASAPRNRSPAGGRRSPSRLHMPGPGRRGVGGAYRGPGVPSPTTAATQDNGPERPDRREAQRAVPTTGPPSRPAQTDDRR